MLQVCPTQGCPELTERGYCAKCSPTSTRNHRGVRRQARGHGAAFDRAVRQFRARACAMRLPGCTVEATSADYTRPGDWTSPLQPACIDCQRRQGAALARAAR